MDGHIDWLSFSLPAEESIPSEKHLSEYARRLLRQQSEVLYEYVYRNADWKRGKGRPPFRYSIQRSDHGVSIFGGGQLAVVLFEITGRGCEEMRDGDIARTILTAVRDRVTRLDFAVDVRTSVRPRGFADNRNHRAFRSESHITSDTGETVYVGSPKSDRFARVYRYNPPHPRHRLLRIEHVFRRGMAANAVRSFLECQSAARFESALGNTWGWNNPVWSPGIVTDERLRAPIVAKEHEDTVLWLYKQVAPALRRVHAAGAIDLEDWWRACFGSPVDPETGEVTT